MIFMISWTSAMVVLARKFRPSVSLQFFLIVEEQNSIGLFDTGFSFKSIHDSQQVKGNTISSKPLYYLHPPHGHWGISWVITADS